jgi:hypothetical protein
MNPVRAERNMMLQPAIATAWQRALRAGLLLLICALGGTFDALNNSVARWTARAAASPEEEELTGKERPVLTASAQHSRRGTARPQARHGQLAPDHRLAHRTAAADRRPAPSSQPTLTGAGIFMHC